MYLIKELLLIVLIQCGRSCQRNRMCEPIWLERILQTKLGMHNNGKLDRTRISAGVLWIWCCTYGLLLYNEQTTIPCKNFKTCLVASYLNNINNNATTKFNFQKAIKRRYSSFFIKAYAPDDDTLIRISAVRPPLKRRKRKPVISPYKQYQ